MIFFPPESVSEGFLLCRFSAGAELSAPDSVRVRCWCGAAAVPPYKKSRKTIFFRYFHHESKTLTKMEAKMDHGPWKMDHSPWSIP